MPKLVFNALTAKQVQNFNKPGMYHDGRGLYLQVSKSGAKSWVYRFRLYGKNHDMGLGGVTTQNKLSTAREKVDEYSKLVKAGKNPIIFKNLEQEKVSKTFEEFGLEIIEQWKNNWVSKKHHHQWRQSISHYSGKMAKMDISQIETRHVIEAIQDHWKEIPDTARRTISRWRRIFDAAKIKQLRTGDNPAAWVGNLEYLLSKNPKLKNGHMKALAYKELPNFWKRISNHYSKSAIALRFTILTAARTSETLYAKKSEFDLENKIWAIPAARMKMKRDHRVPLSDEAFKIINDLCLLCNNDDDLVFASDKNYIVEGKSIKRPLSNMAMLMCLRGFYIKDNYTVHGFRSSFRDWVGDETDYAREIAEAALAHLVGDDAERAYRRGDALERRRAMMQDWADFITQRPAKISDVQ